MLIEVRNSGTGAYWQTATLQLASIAVAENRLKEAADCLEHYVDVLIGETVLPKAFLFSPGLNITKNQHEAAKELRQMLVYELEERYQSLLEYPKCKKAIEKLKMSMI